MEVGHRGYRGKVVLVTGAAGGIGSAVAEQAHAEGATLALWDVNGPGLEALEGRLAAAGPEGSVWSCAVDVSDPACVHRAAADLQARWGRVDVLVHAAGVMSVEPLERCAEEVWHRTLSVNLSGTFHVLRALLPEMTRAGRGSVVLVSSAAAQSPSTPTGIAYVASKAAMLAMMRQLAYRLAATGVRINAIAPGFVDTSMPRSHFAAAALDDAVRRLPMGRMASAKEIANAILFLASERAGYIHGETLHVTGGSLIV